MNTNNLCNVRTKRGNCPKVSMTGIDGSVMHRVGWKEFILDDHGYLKKMQHPWAGFWAEANLCPADYAKLIWPSSIPLSVFVYVGPGAPTGVLRLANHWKTDVSHVIARLVNEWVEEMEPPNWWAADYSKITDMITPHDDGVALIPPALWNEFGVGNLERIDYFASPVTKATYNRICHVHTFDASDVIDYMIRLRCSELGFPVEVRRFTLV